MHVQPTGPPKSPWPFIRVLKQLRQHCLARDLMNVNCTDDAAVAHVDVLKIQAGLGQSLPAQEILNSASTQHWLMMLPS